jgi:hypothetical protein
MVLDKSIWIIVTLTIAKLAIKPKGKKKQSQLASIPKKVWHKKWGKRVIMITFLVPLRDTTHPLPVKNGTGEQ